MWNCHCCLSWSYSESSIFISKSGCHLPKFLTQLDAEILNNVLITSKSVDLLLCSIKKKKKKQLVQNAAAIFVTKTKSLEKHNTNSTHCS